MALDDIKKLNDEINKLRAELGRKPLKPFDEKDMQTAKETISGLSAEIREMGNDLDYIYKSFKDSVNELSKQDRYLSDSRKSLNGIADISKTIIDYRKGEVSLDEKTLQNLQKKAKAQFDELQRIKEVGNLNPKNRKEVEKALADQELFNGALDKTISAQKQVNKQIGLVGTGVEGISKGLSKMGFGNLSQPLTEAIEKTKNARLQILLNREAQKEINELLNLQAKNYDNLTFEEVERFNYLATVYGFDEEKNKKKIEDFKTQNELLSTQTSKYKNIGKALTDQLTKANLIDFAIGQMVDALTKADTQTGQLAKAFGTSYSEAASIRNELNTVANLSGDVNITTGALQESLIALNKEFGTAGMLNKGLLEDFTNMTKVIGYSNEAAIKLGTISQATGTDLSDNTSEILGTARAFNLTNDLALNEKEIVEGVAKASSSVTLSLGMHPGKIASAVAQAKKLGLELEQVEGIAESLLNFESSISNELEAELLTGRSLNLEQARYYALTGNIEGVAKEIAKQNITAAEFGEMNMLQRKSIASAIGMEADELGKALITQEALSRIKVKDEKAAKEKFDQLVKIYGYEKAVKELGDEQYGNQLKSQSIQDRFTASVEKLQEIFVSVAEPILQIVSPFMDLVTTILPAINMLLHPFTESLKFIGQYSKEILATFTVYKGVQLGINIAKGAEYALDLRRLAVANGELGLKNMIKLVENETLAIKITAWTYGLKDMAVEKGKAAWKAVQIGYETTLNGIKKVGALISKGELLQSIGKAAMGAISSLSSIPVIGWALGLAAAGTAIALGYKFMKGDDVMSPGNKTSGYGERTLFGPEGAIQLNNKDTVIAGTNLFGNTFQTPPPASNNLFENISDFSKIPPTSAAPPSITVDMAPLVNEMQAVKAVLVQILNKDSNVYLDGAKVGKGINMARTKIG